MPRGSPSDVEVELPKDAISGWETNPRLELDLGLVSATPGLEVFSKVVDNELIADAVAAFSSARAAPQGRSVHVRTARLWMSPLSIRRLSMEARSG